jgi:hypothetical protein
MMIFGIQNRDGAIRSFLIAGLAAAILIGCAHTEAPSPAPQHTTFASPEDAVQALVTATRNDDAEGLILIFGPEATELIYSGDTVADEKGIARFLKAYDTKNALVPEGERMILVIGSKGWPFPIPLVREGGTWFFDTNQGREEILDRRIGRNERCAIQVCLAIVDAEREYATKDRDGDGLMEYAQEFKSDPGLRNGLYWETAEGEELSPLGPLVTKARREGYQKGEPAEEPSPYHGYYYRLLTAQGEHAPGGAYNYVVDGSMIGGFALVAFPATYGNSGVMTFIVNHDGVVYQKDLGDDTEDLAEAMEAFDPDSTWSRVE